MTMSRRLRLPLAALLAATAVAAPAQAQREFTTQVLLVTPLDARPMALGAQAARAIRSRAEGSADRRELKVVSEGELNGFLTRSGIRLDDFTPLTREQLARQFRADEQVLGTVRQAEGRVRVEAALVLTRNVRLRQPLGVGEGASAGEAARPLAEELVAARRQLVPQRRCENLIRANQPAPAAAAAREGITAYPRATLARACLAEALVAAKAPADSVAVVAEEILAVDSTNAIGLERAATAYDVLGAHDRAAPLWVRLSATDTTDALLAEKVIAALSAHGQAALARPVAERAAAVHPTNGALLRLHFLVLLAVEDWKGALAAGQRLPSVDSLAVRDPAYHGRMITAYQADSQPLRALEHAARAVAAFPADAELYAQYVELVRAEGAAALPRGLAAFPKSGKLAVLHAQALREAGRADEALAETRRALELDGSLRGGWLVLAQAYVDAGRPDSALVLLGRALAAGEPRPVVAQYALARGNALFRAAGGTGARGNYALALRFLTLADSLVPSAQSRFLAGASALAVAQTAAQEGAGTRSCDLARLAGASLERARAGLPAGREIAPEAVAQYLAAAAQLTPYVDEQLRSFCGGG